MQAGLREVQELASATPVAFAMQAPCFASLNAHPADLLLRVPSEMRYRR